MTTAVIVKTHAGWPVDVTLVTIGSSTGDLEPAHLIKRTMRVPPNTERTFYVHGGVDVHVHEVQPYDDPALVPAKRGVTITAEHSMMLSAPTIVAA